MSTSTKTPFATIEEALEDIRAGKMVVVCDDEDRENEGDLAMAAQFVTPDAINFMAKQGRGLDLPGADARALRRARPRAHGGQERVAVRDAVHGDDRGARGRHDRHLRATTGRARSRSRSTRDSAPRDLVQPGHVFPLKAKPGGVLERTGQTEATVDLARLAGLNPGRRHLRDHERRRHDGPRRRPRRLLRAARPEDDHGRRPDRLPAQARQARRARRRHPAARPSSASSPRSATARWSTTSTTSRSSRARSTARATCSCACTPSA